MEGGREQEREREIADRGADAETVVGATLRSNGSPESESASAANESEVRPWTATRDEE